MTSFASGGCEIFFRPCWKESFCFDSSQSTATCWILMTSQVTLAILLFIIVVSRELRYERLKSMKEIRREEQKKKVWEEMNANISANLRRKDSLDENAGANVRTACSDPKSRTSITSGFLSKNGRRFSRQSKKKSLTSGDKSNILNSQGHHNGSTNETISSSTIQETPEKEQDTHDESASVHSEHMDEECKEDEFNNIEDTLCAKSCWKYNTLRDTNATDKEKKGPLFTTHRSLENFLKNNADLSIQFPSEYGPEYISTQSLSISDYVYTMVMVVFKMRESQNVNMVAIASALISATISGVFSMVFKYEHYILQECYDGNIQEQVGFIWKDWIMANAQSLRLTIDGFKFLPIFLLLAYTAFLVDRWRTFMINCHTLQGKIQDIGGMLGGSVACVSETTGKLNNSNGLPLHVKKQLYKIYRYLNVTHILCYQCFLESCRNHYDVIEQLRLEMNLLTEEEAYLFHSMGKKVREGICALLHHEIAILLDENEMKYAANTLTLVKIKISEMRGTMGGIHDMFVRDNPNEYIYALQILMYCFTLLIIFGYPFFTFADVGDDFSLGCFQPMAFLSTYVILLSLRIPYLLFVTLQNPFDAQTGIQVENLIASTEMALFQSMRVLFHSAGGSSSSTLTKSFRRKGAMARSRNFFVRKIPTETKGDFGEL